LAEYLTAYAVRVPEGPSHRFLLLLLQAKEAANVMLTSPINPKPVRMLGAGCPAPSKVIWHVDWHTPFGGHGVERAAFVLSAVGFDRRADLVLKAQDRSAYLHPSHRGEGVKTPFTTRLSV
jgi:hypothetical protein